MRRKRVTGRFYVFLGLLLVGGFFILRELFPASAQEALVQMANATYQRTVDVVIVRDEEVFGFEGVGRVVFVAAEGASVNEGDLVCKIYASGYPDKEFTRLDETHKAIRAYHEQLLDNIKNDELDRIEQRVESNAVQLKTLVRQKTGGSLLNLQAQLQEAMSARQQYLRQNKSDDHSLNELYNQETQRENAIDAWKNDALAPRGGVVSFYLDGFENVLKLDELTSLTFEDARAVLAGKKPPLPPTARLTTDVFRVVSPDKWYAILLSKDVDWNPVHGQVITFTMEGFPDISYAGTVVRSQKSANEVMAQLEINGGFGPLINQRSGVAQIGGALSGLSVPARAVVTQSGQTGVLVNDVPGDATFIPVEVLSRDASIAVVRPLNEGTLDVGRRVLVR